MWTDRGKLRVFKTQAECLRVLIQGHTYPGHEKKLARLQKQLAGLEKRIAAQQKRLADQRAMRKKKRMADRRAIQRAMRKEVDRLIHEVSEAT
jgi:hypothetical protein